MVAQIMQPKPIRPGTPPQNYTGDEEQRDLGGLILTRYVGERRWHYPDSYIACTVAARRLNISPRKLEVMAAAYDLVIVKWTVGKQEHGVISKADVAVLEARLTAQRQGMLTNAAVAVSSRATTLPPLTHDYQVIAAAFRRCGRGVIDARGYHAARFQGLVTVTAPNGEGYSTAVGLRVDQLSIGQYRLVITVIDEGSSDQGQDGCWLRQLVAWYVDPAASDPREVQITKRLVRGSEWLVDSQVAGEVLSEAISQLSEQLGGRVAPGALANT